MLAIYLQIYILMILMHISSIRRQNFYQVQNTSLLYIKNFLKVENDLEDHIIKNLVNAAIESCENYTSRALCNSIWEVSYVKLSKDYFVLPIKPVNYLENITYSYLYNDDNVVIDPKYYKLIEDIVYLSYIPHAHRMKIRYCAGLAEHIEQLPNDLKSILMEHIAYLYENRSGEKQFDISKYKGIRDIII